MKLHRQKRVVEQGGLRATRWTAVLCLVLLVLVTLVQVAHVHPVATDSDHCPICVVMHSAAPVSAVAAAVILLVESAPVPVPVVHSVARPWHCSLFNRPPPQNA